MPNYVTTRLKAKGSEADITRFIERTLRDEKGEKIVDFNRYIPMPDELKGSEKGTMATLGLALLGYVEGDYFNKFTGLVHIGKHKTLFRMMKYPWVKARGITSVEELEEDINQTHPGAIVAGRRALRLYDNYGHTDWYSWSVENWGTKWNALHYCECNRGPGHYECMFDTAWSEPRRVYAAMVLRFPDIHFEFTWFDEGHCHAGEFVRKPGHKAELAVVDSPDVDNNSVDMALYARVYGHSYGMETEEMC